LILLIRYELRSTAGLTPSPTKEPSTSWLITNQVACHGERSTFLFVFVFVFVYVCVCVCMFVRVFVCVS
jgi:hypothetical protein